MSPVNQNPNLLEDALKQALRREEAPENFAAKVLTKAAQNSMKREAQKQSWLRFFSQSPVRWAAFAAITICSIAEGVHYRNQRERAQGEAAKQQLMLALRIAGSKIQLAKSKVNEINTSPSQPQQRNRTPRSRS
jgi:hypothetical protein